MKASVMGHLVFGHPRLALRDATAGGGCRRRLARIIYTGQTGLAALALLGLAACQPEDAGKRELPKVIAAVVEPQVFTPTVELTGTVAARIESDLAFRAGGQVAERLVDVGDHVRAGQLLARIATDEPQATLDAAVAAARSAEATLKQAQANFERQKTLLKGGFTTKSSFDSAEEALRSAMNALDSARADVATAREQLTYTDLKSPAAGIITARTVEQGQVVTAAQTVFTLALDGPRDAVFDVYERATTEEPTKGEVKVRLISDPKVTATARVREISPAFDTATGTLRIKLGLVDAPPQMSLGAAIAGTASFTARQVIRLPWTALFSTRGEPSVWVVDAKSGMVAQRLIAIDRYLTGAILVRDGLKPGETVVTAGGQLLRPGETVTVVADAAPTEAGESADGGSGSAQAATPDAGDGEQSDPLAATAAGAPAAAEAGASAQGRTETVK